MEITLYKKQNEALTSPANELLYGGAAGGGKSYLIRASAVIFSIEIPGLHTYIFRRTFKELLANHVYTQGGFLDMLATFIDQKLVNFDKQNYAFVFKNGSRIQLAHAQWESDIYNHQGAQIQYLIIDESTHFTEEMIRFLRSRVRLGDLTIPKKYKGLFPRILYGSNPGGVGHRYFKRGFVDFGTTMHRAPADDGGMLRQFIPARLDDNKILVSNDPEYADRLRGLGRAQLVDAMLTGDWDMSDTTALPAWTHERNTCEDFRIPAGWQVKRGYDYGFSAPYAVLWVAISNGESYIDSKGKRSDVPRGSVFIIKELYGADEYGQGIKEPPSETAKKVSAIDRDIGRVAAGPADNSIFNREHGPSIADKMGDEGVEWVESNKKPGSRVLGLSLINEMVYEANVEIPERPVLKVFRSCVHTVDQLPHMQLSDKMEDVDTEGVDHIYDVVRYLVLHVSNEAHELNVVGF